MQKTIPANEITKIKEPTIVVMGLVMGIPKRVESRIRLRDLTLNVYNILFLRSMTISFPYFVAVKTFGERGSLSVK